MWYAQTVALGKISMKTTVWFLYNSVCIACKFDFMSDDSTIIEISCDALHNKQYRVKWQDANDKEAKIECQALYLSAKRLATGIITNSDDNNNNNSYLLMLKYSSNKGSFDVTCPSYMSVQNVVSNRHKNYVYYANAVYFEKSTKRLYNDYWPIFCAWFHSLNHFTLNSLFQFRISKRWSQLRKDIHNVVF